MTSTITEVSLRSSLFSAMCGYGYISRYRLWEEMTGRREPEETSQMRYGESMELQSIGAVERATGIWFTHTGDRQRGARALVGPKDREFYVTTTPDGRAVVDGCTVGLEVKTHTSQRNRYDEVPDSYLIQMQGQMFVTTLDQDGPDMERVLYGGVFPDGHLVIWWVHYSHEFIGWMYDHLVEFADILRADECPKQQTKTPVPRDQVKMERVR